ncbi:uncharacterized protein LOC128548318 [Mercenaria mercenaria]|uniref:uncharacterized protein LOC128548318 n=1 Tax=Mercenaria mercenaria TaxID=6596 RepID=UPI00234EE39C|nr:uncharacterized protein LOC128548318 [Mercenaria mercenaria]
MASKATGRALNIDVSGLLDIGCHYAGTLYIQKNSIRKSKWSERFVVIARGWIYIFHDKNAKRAEKTFPLHEFNRVESHHHVSGENFCFCLIYSDLQKKEPVIFSCVVEEAKQTWMKHFDETINEVNRGIYGSQASQADSDYDSIPGEGRNNSNSMLVLAGNQPAIVEADDSGLLRREQMKSSNKWKRMSEPTESISRDEKCYNYLSSARNGAPPVPDESWKRTTLSRNMTEPSFPNTEQDGQQSVTKSHSYADVRICSVSEVTSCASSSRISKGMSSATFICEFQDNAEKMLKEQPVGNYLVCPSKESTWVLLIKTKEEVSKILIHTNGEKSTISFGTNTPVFRSLCDLIKFYQLNKLPFEDVDMILQESGHEYSKQRTVISYRL